MGKFDRYFLMKEQDVIDFVFEVSNFFDPKNSVSCYEIGDGNLNYVFRLQDNKGRSLIVKQAGSTARISSEFVLSTNRMGIESKILQKQFEMVPGLSPVIFYYDQIMNCCLMEDLSDHQILRAALMEGKTFPHLADHLTTFLVYSTLYTTDVKKDHKEKKKEVGNFLNPDLCEITEDLVYTEPFHNHKGRNQLFKPNASWLRRELYFDEELSLEASKLKFNFMNNPQGLIHGDLHTGSIFVRPDSTKVFDPEFAFYGPLGYDVGNMVANLIFARMYGAVQLEDKKISEIFIPWIDETIRGLLDMFMEKFLFAWEESPVDISASVRGFKEWYLQSILKDTAGVTGLELCRRTVGLAKVEDLVSIESEEKRVWVERVCIRAAKKFIKRRHLHTSGADFLATLEESLEERV